MDAETGEAVKKGTGPLAEGRHGHRYLHGGEGDRLPGGRALA